MLSSNIVTAIYIAASVLFILSLGGLSNQEKAKRAVWFGIIGMALAVFGTVFGPQVSGFGWIIPMIIIGSIIVTINMYFCYSSVRIIISISMILHFSSFHIHNGDVMMVGVGGVDDDGGDRKLKLKPH